MEFNGKVILIVGASLGIGRALALRLAGEGADVVDRQRARRIRLQGVFT
jgi:NAD(P)-dependent dehydrogenase (short-subunit alcohol dehydrogenase family)